jgi:hypothetical protein
LPDAPVRRQRWVFLATLLLLLAATVHPAVFTYPAALALGATGVWLGVNLWSVARIYSRASKCKAQM